MQTFCLFFFFQSDYWQKFAFSHFYEDSTWVLSVLYAKELVRLISFCPLAWKNWHHTAPLSCLTANKAASKCHLLAFHKYEIFIRSIGQWYLEGERVQYAAKGHRVYSTRWAIRVPHIQLSTYAHSNKYLVFICRKTLSYKLPHYCKSPNTLTVFVGGCFCLRKSDLAVHVHL